MAYEDYQVGQIQNAVRPMEGVSHPSEAIRADQSFWADTVAAGAQKLFTKNVDDGSAEIGADINKTQENIRNIRQALRSGIISQTQAETDIVRTTAQLTSKYSGNTKAIDHIKKLVKSEEEQVESLDNWKSETQKARESWTEKHPEDRYLLDPIGDPLADEKRLLLIDEKVQKERAWELQMREFEMRKNSYGFNQQVTEDQWARNNQNYTEITQQNALADRQMQFMQREQAVGKVEAFRFERLTPAMTQFQAASAEVARLKESGGTAEEIRAEEDKQRAAVRAIEESRQQLVADLNTLRVPGFASNGIVEDSLKTADVIYQSAMSIMTGEVVAGAQTATAQSNYIANTSDLGRTRAGQEAMRDVVALDMLKAYNAKEMGADGYIKKDSSGNPMTISTTAPFLDIARNKDRYPDQNILVRDSLSKLRPTLFNTVTVQADDLVSLDNSVSVFNSVSTQLRDVYENVTDPKLKVTMLRDSFEQLSDPTILKGLNDLMTNSSGEVVTQRDQMKNTIQNLSTGLKTEYNNAINQLNAKTANATLVNPDTSLVEKNVPLAEMYYLEFDKGQNRYLPKWRDNVSDYTKAQLKSDFDNLTSAVKGFQNAYIATGVVTRNPKVVPNGQLNEESGAATALFTMLGNPEDLSARLANEERMKRLMTAGPANVVGVGGVAGDIAARARTAEKDNQEKNAQTRQNADDFVQSIFGSDRKPAQ